LDIHPDPTAQRFANMKVLVPQQGFSGFWYGRLKVLSNENQQGSWVVSIESLWFAIVPMDILFLI
jgi:hypothetical protein